ncbi:unnamed protein product [Dovyalis caffra]|uniref:TRF2/HOY1 PH-like domain-containing protein n=1 Tax=Dovyalis caffra TaxID=77055 RepID=A0AAV1RWY8_9ROSI|nr:unnamed protein product [Dovyalis caffra]
MVKELDEFHLWAGGDGGTVVNDDDYEDFESLLFRENNKLLAENDDERNMLAFEVNQRIIETPRMSYEQDEMAKKLLRLNPLGLQLNLASNWTNSITNPKYTRTVEAGATYESCEQSRSSIDFGQQPMSEKLKASNFAATFIRIGSWERKSKNEGDLVAKCYFAKKKLVWELLKGGLKSKIEIQWNDIIGISAVIKENEPGTLQVELNLAPTFHEETDPQPRKHTIWKPTSDFTGGQASICR